MFKHKSFTYFIVSLQWEEASITGRHAIINNLQIGELALYNKCNCKVHLESNPISTQAPGGQSLLRLVKSLCNQTR